MSRSWLPLTDEALRSFCDSFLATITTTPTAYGLVVGDVTSLGALTTAYGSALAAAVEPSTRTSVTVAAKDMAKRSLIAAMRNLYKKVVAANLTPDKIEALGLPPRDVLPTPIPPPARAPGISIVSRNENTVQIKLYDPSNPNSRARPLGVSGASVFSFVGEEAPTTGAGWNFEGNTTRTMVNVAFPATITPGSKVWFTAFWFNPRALSGPAATPVGTNLPGGAAMAA